MTSDRRNVSSSLSAQVIEYLRRRKHTQASIARMLGVTEGFVSLVKSRERSLTVDHLERLSIALSVPLGALLLAVSEPGAKPSSKDAKKLYELSAELLDAVDIARGAILNDRARASTRKKSA